MKKSLLAISLITSFAFAEFDTKATVGVTAAELGGKSYTQFGIGYTSNTRLDSGIILGFGNSLYYGNVDSGREVTTLDLDLRAGYEIYQDLIAFGLGTGVYQYFDDNSATGVGYGASLEYKLTDNVAVEGTYKTTNMRYKTDDYDYSTSNVAIKFNY